MSLFTTIASFISQAVSTLVNTTTSLVSPLLTKYNINTNVNYDYIVPLVLFVLYFSNFGYSLLCLLISVGIPLYNDSNSNHNSRYWTAFAYYLILAFFNSFYLRWIPFSSLLNLLVLVSLHTTTVQSFALKVISQFMMQLKMVPQVSKYMTLFNNVLVLRLDYYIMISRSVLGF